MESTNKINFWIGYTPSYKRASEVCKFSLQKFNVNVRRLPLFYEENTSNPFSRTRFLTPIIDSVYSDSEWTLFSDDDFLFLQNPINLISSLDSSKAVYVCKHPEYQSRVNIKMDKQTNPNYPKKNWSSFMIFNNEKFTLTFEEIFSMNLKDLHQFKWCKENEIGEVPLEWNWLVGEYEDRHDVNALHYTLGGPWYEIPFDSNLNSVWFEYEKQMIKDFK